MAAEKLPIRSIRYIGTFPRHRTEKWWMVGQDGGQSVTLEEGRTLFVFSDTLLAARASEHPHRPIPRQFAHELGPQGMFLANCAGVARSRDLQQAWAEIRYYSDTAGFPREMIEPIDRERLQKIRFWPEHGIELDGKVYLYYLGIQTTDPTTIWGFQTVGTGLAVVDPDTGDCQRLWWGDDWHLWKNRHDDFHFGVQVLAEEGWLYVFGSVRQGLFSHGRLARVRPGEIAKPRAYEYLASVEPSWSSELGEACDLGLCGADYSVSYNAHLGRYLMFFVDHYEKVLMLRTACRPWGPYADPIRVVGLPHEPASEMVYLGFEHPDFSKNGGRTVYVSYCQPRFVNNSLLTLELG